MHCPHSTCGHEVLPFTLEMRAQTLGWVQVLNQLRNRHVSKLLCSLQCVLPGVSIFSFDLHKSSARKVGLYCPYFVAKKTKVEYFVLFFFVFCFFLRKPLALDLLGKDFFFN